MFGIVVAVISRLLALVIGLVAGYSGGFVDRALMSINDTFIVIPLFPILVLFYFVMKDHMSWGLLALMMACLGWAYDARLIRSVALSLRTREFTETGIFSGMSMRRILVEEHLPYVLPIVFSTTMNNINWSIGLEVTLSVLGFTDINTPTIGVLIYWANQHTALVAGIWWWIFFPVLLVVLTFIGLFLLAVSMNEHIDPRSRLGRSERDERTRPRSLGPARLLPHLGVRHRARGARGRRCRPSRRGRRDLRPGGRIELRQDHADQDHRQRHPAAARGAGRLGRVQLQGPARSTCIASAATSCATSAGSSCRYIMQGSMNVLNPVRRVRHAFVDFAFRHIGKSKAEFLDIVRAHLQRLHLAPDVLDAYPHQLSGGMRQRVTIALATVCRPEFIIADEPTTALDVVVQKGVLAMIHSVQRELGSSVIFVTHDMAVHANLTDRLGIMYAGRLVEEGRTADVFRRPRHPYTAHLIASLPRLGDTAPKEGLTGAPPNLADPPPGCRFHPRCPLASDICRREVPPMTRGRARPPRRLLPQRPGGAAMTRRCSRSTTSSRLYSSGGLLAAPTGRRRGRRQPAARRGQAGDRHGRSANRAAARPRSRA